MKPTLKIIGSISLALLVSAGTTHSVSAQHLIDSYVAFISSDDKYNSSGTRLWSAGAILQQDRADYHRFNSGEYGADEYDKVFGSRSNRSKIPSLLSRGSISSSTRRAIVNRKVAVKVRIYGWSRNSLSHIRVTR